MEDERRQIMKLQNSTLKKINYYFNILMVTIIMEGIMCKLYVVSRVKKCVKNSSKEIIEK